ncbi:hypothetical protein HYV87_00100 [Candidatus Woesearchaeota archaeon]|nr:hypothetical protein [Candidatus Woesearchaeota archaeon]
MNYISGMGFINCLLEDKVFVEVFCHQYNTSVVEIIPNTEESPPRGLMYIFDGQNGGFNIKGIKNSLDKKFQKGDQ